MRHENPVPFEERIQYVDWLCKVTGGNAFPYVQLIEEAVRPDRLSKDKRDKGLRLLQDLENLIKKSTLARDQYISSRIMVQVEFARNSLNSVP